LHMMQFVIGILNLFLCKRLLVLRPSLSNNQKTPYAFPDTLTFKAIGRELRPASDPS
jgi:hypothetical protein